MGSLFLPFTPAGRESELIAIDVKSHLGLTPYEAVDPFAVLPAVPARLVSEDELSVAPAATLSLLLRSGSDEWSAVSFRSPLDDGEEWIVLNPNDHPHRQRATLMEEITHAVRRHPRVCLAFDGQTRWQRPFDSAIEDEAYNVGAACMIPYRWLFRAVNDRGRTAEFIARRFNVSVDYVEFRIKRAGLYRIYRDRQRRSG